MVTTWPALPLEEWRDTKETLNRWMQIAGKITLGLTPLVNHFWNTGLRLSSRGLRTVPIPYGSRVFDMEFDFVVHALVIRVSDGTEERIALRSISVAELDRQCFAALHKLGIECDIWTTPVEIADPIPLDQDEVHRAYDPDAVRRFWQILTSAHKVFSEFRSRFTGKCGPVVFWWGSFDLAVTRFSGRRAPAKEGADSITREAYSHEVSSVGFWPGDDRLALPAFYSYAAPEPAGFRDSKISPSAAYYHATLGGFYLHLDELRKASDPDRTLLDFCQSVYEAAANLGNWDRAALER
jgi:uncharacterized protein DUF5996